MWVIDAWGYAIYIDGFQLPADLLDPDDYEAARRQSSRQAAISQARQTATQRLRELTAEGKLSISVTDTMLQALDSWAQHRWDLGQATRYAAAAGTDTRLNSAKVKAEQRDRQLRHAWADPLYAVVDAPTKPAAP